MMMPWRCKLRVTRSETRLLVTGTSGDLLKARLDTTPSHPRALLTLLEGISLWRGEPLRVALSADLSSLDSPDSTLFGAELWPAESLLVRFEVDHPERRGRRIEGLGDFRAVRRVLGRSQ